MYRSSKAHADAAKSLKTNYSKYSSEPEPREDQGAEEMIAESGVRAEEKKEVEKSESNVGFRKKKR